MQFFRFLHNRAVTAVEMSSHAAAGTALRVTDRDVVAIQDTSELAFGGRRRRAQGFGPVGRGGASRGLLLHPVLALDAGTGALLGLVDIHVWNRTGGPTGPQRLRATKEKESQRWLDGAARAGEVLASASQITVVADRESDIYEEFVSRPPHVHLIVRAAQNRRIETLAGKETSAALFSFADALPEQHRLSLVIPAAPGRKPRAAELALRYSLVVLRKPRNGAAQALPQTVTLTLLDVRETARPVDSAPVHWRLLTTHPITNVAQARRVLDLYRRRWTIEEFFRTLKTAGFDIEETELTDPKAMTNFIAAATIAAVTVMQLVQARDGNTAQHIADAFNPADQPILEAISTRLEGKTLRQKNPHPKGSLAFAAWVIARLGGWDSYYGKPGPHVMRRGLHDFQRIKYGATLPGRNL